MVSKLEILARYYQIHVDHIDSKFFTYQNKQYFITDTIIEPMLMQYYVQYINTMQVPGFQIIHNCFGNIQSEGYCLYSYHEQEYDFIEVVTLSLKKIEKQTTSIKIIKESWSNIIDDARKAVASHASRINHNEYYVILSYYYQGMAENAINILNEILKVDPRAILPVGLEHVYCSNRYEYLFNPHNVLISTRVRDIALYYKNGYITIKMMQYYISISDFTQIELMYLYARVIFPSEFFTLILNGIQSEIALKEKLIVTYNNLEIEKQRIIELYQCLKNYVYIPKIHWLENI